MATSKTSQSEKKTSAKTAATSKKSETTAKKTATKTSTQTSSASSKSSGTKVNATGSKSSRKQKKPSKALIIILVILVVLAVLCYFFKPDWFNAGRNFVLNLLEPQTTEQTVSTSTTTSSSATGETDTGYAMTSENLPLYFGNPSGATTEIKNAKNYLMEKVQYSLSYNAEKYIPNWVMWHLAKVDVGTVDRMDDFRPDTDLPEGFYGVKKADYQYNDYGFDRGHVCPSADRTKTTQDNSMTFLMTNMIPQSPNCNRNVWRLLEAYERDLAEKNGKELYIAAGPYGRGGTSDKGTFDEIPLKNGKGAIEVPEYCWKIVLILDEGENDFSRVNENSEVIAVWMPNNQAVSEHTWDYYITNIDYIEEKTGFDFFAALPNVIEDSIEAKKYEYKK